MLLDAYTGIQSLFMLFFSQTIHECTSRKTATNLMSLNNEFIILLLYIIGGDRWNIHHLLACHYHQLTVVCFPCCLHIFFFQVLVLLLLFFEGFSDNFWFFGLFADISAWFCFYSSILVWFGLQHAIIVCYLWVVFIGWCFVILNSWCLAYCPKTGTVRESI